MLRLVNAARASGRTCGGTPHPAVPPLTMEPRLRCAARLHALDMGVMGYFSHTGRDGSNPGTRISRTGYSYRTWGENIAAGQRNAAAVVNAWLGSAGHCRNIMNASFTELGVGYYASTREWVQVFAAPR